MNRTNLGSGDLTVVGVQISPSALTYTNNGFRLQVPHMITLATWAVAPDWLTLQEAALLLGPAYDANAIRTLIAIGAIDAEQDEDGAWLVEKIGLAEYQTALWEVLTYEQ